MMSRLTRRWRFETCDTGVTRQGEFVPCDKPAVALRAPTPEEVHEFKPQATVQQQPKEKPPTAAEIMQQADPAPEETGEVEMITKPQSTKLHALMGDPSLSRDDMLAMATEEAGREISTSKDLTKAEASRLIDQLDGLPRPVDAEVVEP